MIIVLVFFFFKDLQLGEGKAKAQSTKSKLLPRQQLRYYTAPLMLRGTDLKKKGSLDPLLGEDQPFRSMSIGVEMRGLAKSIPFPKSR